MRATWWRRLAVAVGLLLLGIVLLSAGLLWALSAGQMRAPLLHWLEARSGRHIEVGGALEVHLWTRHPWIRAERLTIGNPPWMPAGITARIAAFTLSVDPPWYPQGFRFATVTLQGASLTLQRQSNGNANWQLRDPAKGSGSGLPVIGALTAPQLHLELDDERRQLRFSGTVWAADAPTTAAAAPPRLRVGAAGTLNGRHVSLGLDGDPLRLVRANRPWRFTVVERSSGAIMTARLSLPRPNDFSYLSGDFDAVGADIKDLYLVGLSLIDTGPFHLTGHVERQDLRVQYELRVTSGQSDMQGTLQVDMRAPRTRVEGTLSSRRLRLADLGLQAAGREPPGSASPLLVPTQQVSLAGFRSVDWRADYRAQQLQLGRLLFDEFGGHLNLHAGLVDVTGLRAALARGEVQAHFQFDAQQDEPPASFDAVFHGLDMSSFAKRGAPPSIEGRLDARVHLTGHGRSLHEFAAHANGTLDAIVPSGALRAALAELASNDLKALGLFLRHDQHDVAIRCGVARIEIRDGDASAAQLLLDTDPVLINARGGVQLNSERIDLSVSGAPKERRLVRMQAPLLLAGTLRHPDVKLGGGHLKLLDGGNAPAVDCALLRGESDASGARLR